MDKREDLTDREKLEIEEYAEKLIKNKPVGVIGTIALIGALITTIGGLIWIIAGVLLLFIFWPIGLIAIIIGVLMTNSLKNKQEKEKRLKIEEKEKLVKELQLRVLNGEKLKKD
jgi:hypothetical protein